MIYHKLSATLELTQPPNDAGYTLKDILALLDNNGIKQGIDEATIKKMLEKEIYESPITVAKGKLPVDGEAGYYTYHFRTKMPSLKQYISFYLRKQQNLFHVKVVNLRLFSALRFLLLQYSHT